MFVRCVKLINNLKWVTNVSLMLTKPKNVYTTAKYLGEKTEESNKMLGDVGAKYQIFQDKDSSVILDIHEERLKYKEIINEQKDDPVNPFEGINIKRGINGVFEIEDLVHVLRRENAIDLCVIAVPLEIQYVDYICIVTGNSQRHMSAIAQFVKKVYKQKRNMNDFVPRIEGKKSKDWLALDLGNIALHILSPAARKTYDLESLWSLGPDLDSELNKPEDPTNEMLEKHSIYLQDLHPAVN